MIKKAVILCGGLATRFLPYSKSIPKEMLPLLDKPIMQVLVEDLVKAGITDILIILGRNKECIIHHFDHNIELENRLKDTQKVESFDMVNKVSTLANIYYRMQDYPKGTGYALTLAKSFVGKSPFMFLFGDEIMISKGKNQFEQLLDNFNRYKKPVIAVYPCDKKDVVRYGIIKPKYLSPNAIKVEDLIEKPNINEAPSTLCYIGSCILTFDIFKAINNCKNDGLELPLTDAFKSLINNNNLMAQIIKGSRYDIGNKFGFVKANIEACLNDKIYKEDIKRLINDLYNKINNH